MKTLLQSLAIGASLSACLVALPAAAQSGKGFVIHPDGAAMGPTHGIPGCLDWNTNKIFKSPDWDKGYKHYGADLHVYDNCIPDANQVWYLEGKLIATYVPDRKTGNKTAKGVTKFCMDLNRGAKVEGKGHRVIGWSDCHGTSIQQWTAHQNGALTVNWDNRTYCLTWDGDNPTWASELYAKECKPADATALQKWVVVERN